MRQVEWTGEEVTELEQRWASEDSASTIGRAMGKTRNAILGKVHRLGLPSRENRNGAFYGYKPEPNNTPPNRTPRSSVFKSGEQKPRLAVPNPSKTPPLVTVLSARTGMYITLKKTRQYEPEYTKDQLRAQLTQAVINTARLA